MPDECWKDAAFCAVLSSKEDISHNLCTKNYFMDNIIGYII